MTTSFFIARRIFLNKDGEKQVSPPAVRIALVSIALGLAVMILSVAIIVGFKKEVRNKVIGFGSHIQITRFDSNNSYATQPIAVSDSLVQALRALPNVRHIDRFATLPGMIKTKEDIQAVVFKGIDEDYDWDFFRQNLVEGDVLQISPDSMSNKVVVSRMIADKLSLKLADSFVVYFIEGQSDVRARRFHIAGIYQTNFSDYDKLFVLADLKQIRKLSNWDEDLVSGLELLVKDYDRLDETASSLFFEMQGNHDRLGNSFYTRSIKQMNPAIFAWLDVLDLNVWIILLLMLLVSGFSMISGLLIIILERTNMIGILKALGNSNREIRKIFLYVSAFLISKGLIWGNAIAIGLCLIQKYTGIFKLDPATYYVSEVPISLNLLHLLALNAGTLLVILLMMIGPSYLVSKISPAKTIRFE